MSKTLRHIGSLTVPTLFKMGSYFFLSVNRSQTIPVIVMLPVLVVPVQQTESTMQSYFLFLRFGCYFSVETSFFCLTYLANMYIQSVSLIISPPCIQQSIRPICIVIPPG